MTFNYTVDGAKATRDDAVSAAADDRRVVKVSSPDVEDALWKKFEVAFHDRYASVDVATKSGEERVALVERLFLKLGPPSELEVK